MLRADQSRQSVRLSQDIDYKKVCRIFMKFNMADFHKPLQQPTSCVNRLSDCHTFIVRRSIVLSFKPCTNKLTVISVEQNQWKERDTTSELKKKSLQFGIISIAQDKIRYTYIAPFTPVHSLHSMYTSPIKVPPSHHLTPCTLTTPNVHLTNYSSPFTPPNPLYTPLTSCTFRSPIPPPHCRKIPSTIPPSHDPLP